MNKKLKIIVISIVLIGLFGFVAYNYVMHGGERNLSSETTDFEVTSKAISAEFTTDIDVSNKKYLEKAIAISGTVTAVSGTEITIDNMIICTLKSPNTLVKKKQSVTVKGRVVGYDDLMGELRLDQCFLINNN
jgi:ssDNA-binding replication factor A large subunit